MDWNTLLISTVPALITGVIAYLSASKKAKVDLDKAKVDQETALKTIESNQRLAIETIEKTAQNELEKMRTATLEEIKMYEAKSEMDMKITEKQRTMEQVMPYAGSIFGSLLSGEKSVEEVAETMKNLQEFSESFKGK